MAATSPLPGLPNIHCTAPGRSRFPTPRSVPVARNHNQNKSHQNTFDCQNPPLVALPHCRPPPHTHTRARARTHTHAHTLPTPVC